MPERPPSITCGCGFVAAGDEDYWNLRALQDHACPNAPARPPSQPRRWYQYLFSFWGFCIVLILVILAEEIWVKP